MAKPLLRVQKLVRRFGGIIATDHVSLEIPQGELHAIIGPNGAGKTTLISQLTGHLMPHAGSIFLGGMGTLFGPAIGAVVYLVLEELLSQVTEYWAIIMGPLLLLIVLFGRGGIMGLLGRFSRG